MKWWKQIVISLAMIFLGVGSFFEYRIFAKHRDLQETLLWMDQTYNPHAGGHIFGQGYGQEIRYVRNGDSATLTRPIKRNEKRKLRFWVQITPPSTAIAMDSVPTITANVISIPKVRWPWPLTWVQTELATPPSR